MDKSKIKNSTKAVGCYLSSSVPQTYSDGRIRWYYSGSMALNLYSLAKSMRFITLDENWRVLDFSNYKVNVTSDAQKFFTAGARKITEDLDLVAKDDDFSLEMTSVASTRNLRKKFPDDLGYLCEKWAYGTLTAAFLDILNGDRTFNGHHVAELTLESGERIYTINPLDFLIHKISETLIINKEHDPEMYQKNLKDISSIYNAVSSMGLIDENTFNYIVEVSSINGRQSAVNKCFVSKADQVPKALDGLKKDIEPLIDDENKESFGLFIEDLDKFAASNMSTETPVCD